MATNPASLLPSGFVIDSPAPAPAAPLTPIIAKPPPPQTPAQASKDQSDAQTAAANAVIAQNKAKEEQLNEQKQAAQKQLVTESSRDLYQSIEKAKRLVNNWSTGIGGRIGEMYPGSDQANQLQSVIDGEVKGNIFENWMNNIKELVQQGQGAGFGGRIMQSEIPMVTNAMGALNPVKMGRQGTLDSLNQIEDRILRTTAITNGQNPDDPDIISKYRTQFAPPASGDSRNGAGAGTAGHSLAGAVVGASGGASPPGGGSTPPGSGPNAPSTDPTQKSVGLFGDQEGYNPAGAQQFHDAEYQALKSGQIKSYADLQTWVQGYNKQNSTDWPVAEDVPQTHAAIAAAVAGKPFGVGIPQITATEQERLNQRIATNKANNPEAAATAAGVANTGLAGADRSIAAVADATNDALHGKGFDYTGNLNADTAYLNEVQNEHPGFYIAGQIAGGLALPTGVGAVADAAKAEAVARGASDADAALIANRAAATQMSKAGAGYGALYGFNSTAGQPLSDRLGAAAEGGVAGAAIPMVLRGAGKGARGVVSFFKGPDTGALPLIDPVTGELNQPLDAAGPAARYGALQSYGITPPMGATGGRSARLVDQTLFNLAPSAGVMEDAANTVGKQASSAADNVAANYGTASTLNEAGKAAQSGLNQWLARAEGVRGTPDKGLAGKLFDAIPIAANTNAVLDSTRATLAQLTQGFGSNKELSAIAAENPTLKRYLDALTPKTVQEATGVLDANGQPITRDVQTSGGLSWRDMKDFRSLIGTMIGERPFLGDNSPATGQLRALYGALSQDMEATARAQGPQALARFQRANDVFQAIQQRKEQALSTILGPDAMKNPEAAAQAIQKMTMSKGGDLGTLEQVRASMIKSGEWNNVASALIRLGGKPAGAEGRAFNPQTFVNWYSGMTEKARGLLFGDSSSPLRQSLDGFVAASQQLGKVKALANTSNTAPVLSTGRALTAGAVLAIIHPLYAVGAAAAAAGDYALSKMWTSPNFVRWATGYSRAVKAGNLGAARARIGRLTQLATTNPELRAPLVDLQQRLLGALNDNAAPRAAASPDQGTNQQQ